ncbi:FAD-binding protein [Arthrobacter sp. HY1533]|uniref:FAD-binding protein n=1 Tax=Arthrobacter sp. HY1533 TaxID=2970919 RepID=UPI0022B9E71F|nr:FAD-binding protein [Arthrobacter sp. HY1533]
MAQQQTQGRERESNWAGNHHYRAAALHRPETVEQLQELVRGAAAVQALGSGHSFNAISDCDGIQVCLDKMPPLARIDEQAMTVTVDGGSSYGALATALAARGFALANLASLPHISVAGAIATATHGSGDGNANLAAAVVGLTLVDGTGEVRQVDAKDTPDFAGYVVGLGALGIVTEVTLAIEPAFTVAQHVYRDLPWEQLLADFDAVTGRAYSVSLFTDWSGDTVGQAWFKQRPGDGRTDDYPAELLGGTAATAAMHPLPGVSAVNCTQQLGVAGPWQDRLSHFRMAFMPSAGEEIQSEYLVDRAHAVPAINALRALSGIITPLLQVAEIRTVAADGLWLSTASGRDSVAFHFTWLREQAAVEEVVKAVEAALAPFGARPHWGKVFDAGSGALAPLYPRFADFVELAQRLDPEGKFRNAFLDEKVFGI